MLMLMLAAYLGKSGPDGFKKGKIESGVVIAKDKSSESSLRIPVACVKSRSK